MSKWGLIALAWSATTNAQPDRSATLFEQGRVLAAQGKYAEACARFDESYALDAAAGTEINVGDCQEHLGHLAEAWRRFDDAATRFETAHDGRVTFARERRDALVPRIGVVVVEHVDPSARVTIAGRVQPPSAELRDHVDPGDIEIRAGAVARHVHVAAGATVVVDLAPPAIPQVERPEGIVERRRLGRVVLAYTLGGAGAVTGAVALGLALKARGDYNSQFDNGNCTMTSGASVCNVAGADRQRDAVGLADVGTGLAIVGIATIIAGAVVYVTAPKDRIVVAPIASASAAGVFAAGSF